jgi:hypothetical protein
MGVQFHYVHAFDADVPFTGGALSTTAGIYGGAGSWQ